MKPKDSVYNFGEQEEIAIFMLQNLWEQQNELLLRNYGPQASVLWEKNKITLAVAQVVFVMLKRFWEQKKVVIQKLQGSG